MSVFVNTNQGKSSEFSIANINITKNALIVGWQSKISVLYVKNSSKLYGICFERLDLYQICYYNNIEEKKFLKKYSKRKLPLSN